jgi:hypothetical protein
MNKRNILMMPAIAAAGTSIITVGSHYAHAAGSTSTSLSQAIASKLNVSSTDVQSAITSYRDTKQADRTATERTNYETKLTTAVSNGKITADQKAKLLTEFDTVEAKMTDLQKQMQTVRSDAEKWASDNGIDASYLRLDGPGGHGGPSGPAGGM